MPSGPRDSTTCYLDVDPLSIVDLTLVDYVDQHGGAELLDLGCGLGGYAKILQDRGHTLTALDVNPKYVEIAQALGVAASHYDGQLIPLPDDSVDTVFMIEVLEHIPDPARLLPELRRVARRNVIITVPNCTQSFAAPIAFSHYLELDHKNFFTVDTLAGLLGATFATVSVEEVMPVDLKLASDVLSPAPLFLWRAARKLGLIRDRYFFRLIADATV